MWLGSTPAGVGLVPLAPLTHVSEADLPEVVRRMADRINAGAERPSCHSGPRSFC